MAASITRTVSSLRACVSRCVTYASDAFGCLDRKQLDSQIRVVVPRGNGRIRCSFISAFLICLTWPLGVSTAIASGVVPRPSEEWPSSGRFLLTDRTAVVVLNEPDGARAAAKFLMFILSDKMRDRRIENVRRAPNGAAIIFARAPDLGPEAYELEINTQRIIIRSNSPAGYLYGAVTLAQLLPAGTRDTSIANIVIRDYPARPWRGLLLDSARHYQSPAFIMQLLDAMALMKLNVLHWHLTDDQGWRLQIRRYPRLTTVGAFRTPPGRLAGFDIDPITKKPRLEGGFYSQSVVRKLVRYARERQVTIIPEIELPGHASAAIAAYPELGSVAVNSVPADWGVYPHVFNLSESTCRFLENVLEEVIELFPAPYVHVGGDEVAPDEWQTSSAALARVRELGLKDVNQLPHYVVARLGGFLKARGRRLVGWDEIVSPGLARDAIVLSWHGGDAVTDTIRTGHDVVVATQPTLYLDYRQSRAADEPPGRLTTETLADIYRVTLVPSGASGADDAHVLGIQGNLWTEHIGTEERAFHALLPRAAAIAEIGWSPPALQDYAGFVTRLPPLLGRFRALGLPYADSEFAVRFINQDNTSLTLATMAGVGEIHYTLDGSEPVVTSPRYAGPLRLPIGSNVRAATFMDALQMSLSRSTRFVANQPRKMTGAELTLCSQGIGLALEMDTVNTPRPIVAVDLYEPCWKWNEIDFARGIRATIKVGTVPFNYQLGADAAEVSLGLSKPSTAELEVRVDRCDGLPEVVLSLVGAEPTELSALEFALPPLLGRHDLCLRFSRPTADPLWVISEVTLRD